MTSTTSPSRRRKHVNRQQPPQPIAATTSPTAHRIPIIDKLRGIAICMMIAYHFLFDTCYFGYTQFNFLAYLPWGLWRHFIVSSFLLLVGISFVLAENTTVRHRWKRISLLGLCASVVSASSYLTFPASYIYFGVLHFNFLVALFAKPLLGLRKCLLPLAVTILLAGQFCHWPALDPKIFNWLGCSANTPITEDFVPLVPWLAVVLIGIACGRAWGAHRFMLPKLIARVNRALPNWLGNMGRHSLLIYLIHQPLLFGAFELVRYWRH